MKITIYIFFELLHHTKLIDTHKKSINKYCCLFFARGFDNIKLRVQITFIFSEKLIQVIRLLYTYRVTPFLLQPSGAIHFSSVIYFL